MSHEPTRYEAPIRLDPAPTWLDRLLSSLWWVVLPLISLGLVVRGVYSFFH